MKNTNRLLGRRLCAGASIMALTLAANLASAQDGPSAEDMVDEIIVNGIRGSLQRSLDIKRNARGVVDAISAEDIGKFPDSNLAESLQRITGVAIDRERGEGSRVTVRGFGPEFNLVTLNGRQMPVSSLANGDEAPSTRAFDFANLASEAISTIEVYKTGRAAVPSGGIGSTINLKTTRPLDAPGLQATVSYKHVSDDSRIDGSGNAPEISALFSNSWEDTDIGDFGVSLTLIEQERKSGAAEATVGWRDAFMANEDGWGALRDGQTHTNRPTGDEVYRVPQNMGYNLINYDSERSNGQLTLQWRPTDSWTATLDVTQSSYEIERRNNDVSIWFDHGDGVVTAWGDGNPKPILSYAEDFGAGETDYSMGAGLTSNGNEDDSIGLNLEYEAASNLRFVFDYHDSTAESKPNGGFGSNNVFGTRAQAVQSQRIDFSNELPLISVTSKPVDNPDGAGQITDTADVRLRQPTGNAFRNGFFKHEIEQTQLSGTWEPTDDMSQYVDSLDFGIGIIDSNVRSAYGFIQNDTWGGTLQPEETPDDLFTYTTLPDKFSGVGGSSQMIPGFHRFRFEDMAALLFDRLTTDMTGICGPDNNCVADYTTDRRIMEETSIAYIQADKEFSLMGKDAYIRVGLRYEETDITSSALVPVPTGTTWGAVNEFGISFGSDSDFTTATGNYDYLLPSVDFDVDVMEDVKLRASYSETFSRPSYADMQGGFTISSLFRTDGGTGNVGNPDLEPYESENIDLSAEYYYGDASYISAGYFEKTASNWIGGGQIESSPFQIRHPGRGPRFQAAQTALRAAGQDANNLQLVRDWIRNNTGEGTSWVAVDRNNDGDTDDLNEFDIIGLAEDPLIVFTADSRDNSDREQTVDGIEFAWQHDFEDTSYLAGYGFIANYTIVDGDIAFDNQLPSSASQFALVGLSDTANLTAYYDRDGLNARISYNWRDTFLSGAAADPTYTEEYEQIDFALSYEIPPQHMAEQNVTVFLDGVNLTEEGRRTHGRHQNTVFFVAPGHARYYAGIRWKY